MSKRRFQTVKCGNCGKGGNTAVKFATRDNARDHIVAIKLVCTCGVETVFDIEAPTIRINYSDSKGDGSHCVGWDKR